jgi:hypothetical protein
LAQTAKVGAGARKKPYTERFLWLLRLNWQAKRKEHGA